MSNKEKMIQNSVDRLKGQAYQLSNSFEYETAITTLTGIKKRITEQKFYEVRPSEYMPVIVGENAYMTEYLKWRSFLTGENFENGVFKSGSFSTRKATANTVVEPIKVSIFNWQNQIEYNIFDLQQAAKAGNWDRIEALEKSRFKSWQLGIQRIAFLGMEDQANVDGLLTQSDVNINTTTIPTFIKDMTQSQFDDLITKVLDDFAENSNETAIPSAFVVPAKDWRGLSATTSDLYATSKGRWLEDMFKERTGNANFKILPLSYANKERNNLALNRYVLYSFDPDTLAMDIPVDYTTTLTDTINGYEYQSVAYGQFTGCKAYRPSEVLYFDHSD